eukprot:TRINITY_DN50699_c0_g1_i1.p1 TRINITY_DN50699_c0_g1~~TRINITY_DN50699_c0_g1_i1.p1  ORF type:complete len:189 (+),score=62.27 TRINITY_DN50699_c0_g1_i1:136-702(+)
MVAVLADAAACAAPSAAQQQEAPRTATSAFELFCASRLTAEEATTCSGAKARLAQRRALRGEWEQLVSSEKEKFKSLAAAEVKALELARMRRMQATREAPAMVSGKAKRARSTAGSQPLARTGDAEELVIEPDVLAEAKQLGLEASLRNLANRPEMLVKLVPSRRMLDALRESEGLVNKAKNLILAEG